MVNDYSALGLSNTSSDKGNSGKHEITKDEAYKILKQQIIGSSQGEDLTYVNTIVINGTTTGEST